MFRIRNTASLGLSRPLPCPQLDTATKPSRDEHHIIFGAGKPWKLERWSSDAEFLYWGQIGDSPTQTLICCNATYVEWSERPVVTAKRTVLRCEIIGSANQFDVVSSDPEAIVVDREGWRMLL